MILAVAAIQAFQNLFSKLCGVNITQLVVYSLGNGHTHTHARARAQTHAHTNLHTDDLHSIDFKEPSTHQLLAHTCLF